MHENNGRRALVCGASRGIGRACAEALASDGASVTLLARDETRLRELVETLPHDPSQTHAVIVADADRPDEAAARVVEHITATGPIEVLVNNGGGPPGGPAIAAPAEEFVRAFRQHLLMAQAMTQALVPGMKARGFGRIVNIISTSVKQPIPGLGVSNTIRGAVANWSKTIATELAPFGITVNNVLPGMTMTDRLRALIATRAGKEAVSEGEIEERMRREIPAGRFAEAHEIAAVVRFLCSPLASYVTGINVPVDGGRTSSL